MPVRTDIVYCYDGSGEGLLCCIFDAYARRERPMIIWSGEAEEPTLFDVHRVHTDPVHAQRVKRAIETQLGAVALEWIRGAFLSDLEDREVRILEFVQLGIAVGRDVTKMLSDPRVDVIYKAVRRLVGEAHLLKGFVRFSDFDGVLCAEIAPKNQVLPLLSTHFRTRLPGERFLIYDRTHRQALVHADGQSRILSLEHWEMPSANRAEQAYRKLWRRFYDTIAIQARENPKCRQTHMPKRFWNCMTEFDDHNLPAGLPPAEAQGAGGCKTDGFAV